MRFIHIVHPTRSRPKKSVQTINKFVRLSDHPGEVMVTVCLDDSDPRLKDYWNLYRSDCSVHWGIVQLNNKSSVEAINNGFKNSNLYEAPDQIIMVVSDDTDCFPGWDTVILKTTEGKSDFLLRVSDGHQKRICTLPIMDRVYYNRFGYIYNPIYSHSWADTELTEVSYQLGRIIVRNDIVFPHLHPEVTKEPKDDLYKRNDLTHDRDRPLYQQRKKINFGL